MKKYKNTLVSVLLLSFLFLTMHDFVIAKLDSSNHFDALSMQSHLLNSSSKNLNTVDDIHENIHTLVAVNLDSLPKIYAFIIKPKPIATIEKLTSNAQSVQERPPLV